VERNLDSDVFCVILNKIQNLLKGENKMSEVQTKPRREKMMGELNPAKKEETRKKISEKLKLAWARPEVRAKIMGDKNPTKRPEVRAKISAALKATWGDPVKKEAIKAKIAARASARRAAKAAAAVAPPTV